MPVISKIFEKCITNIIESYFKFSDNQYGFVNNGGCGKAVFTFRQVVNYFRDRGSDVHCCSLDITKAFDRINHQALLNAMKNTEMPGCIVKSFANWWCKLQDVIMWNWVRSEAFLLVQGSPNGVYWEKNFSIC